MTMPQETMPPPETEATAGDIRRVRVADVDDEIDLLQLARMVLQGKRVILKFALISAALTAILVLMMKPVYTAEATFLPPNSMSSSSPASMLGQLGALSGTASALGGLKDPAQIYVGILGSRTVADDLIQRFDLAKVYGTKKLSQTERALKSSTSIVEGKDSIVVIAVEDHDAKRASEMANAYLTALAKQNDRIAVTQAAQRRLFFEQQLEREKNTLADAEVALAEIEKKTGLIQPGGQAQLQMSTIAQTQAEIASRDIQLKAMSQSATEQNPDVIRLHSEIDGLREQLARLENSNSRGAAGNIQVPTAKVPELTLIYVRQAREVKYHEALYELLLRQYESAKLDESHSAPLMQVVDYATVPDTKSGPKRTLLTFLAALLGGFAGAVWVLVRYAMNVSMQESKDAHPNKKLDRNNI